MRRTILMGLGLALSLAGTAAAQQAGQDQTRRPRPERSGDRGPAGAGGRFDRRGGPEGFLFKDITLTDAQKAQVKQLRESEHASAEANRSAMKFDEARAARQRGDTAAVKAIMARNRAAMEKDREQHLLAVRNILTTDQRIQFDKNIAELKQRQLERGKGHAKNKRSA